MNHFEYASKTMLLYSLKKNERIDLSCLPDDIFDKVLRGLSATGMCVEGSVFTGKYIKDETQAAGFIEMLSEGIAPRYPRIRRLIAYLNGLTDGDVFRIVSDDAPTMNKQLAVMKMNGLATGANERQIHNDYMMRWGLLSTGFRHYAFGYDGIKTVIGEGNKQNRVCRFCGKRAPQATYNSVAHAISEGLGNQLLFCNEECYGCNNKLSKTESNLMNYLDVRRAMGGILTKTDGAVPSVDGKGFVIRGDDNNQAVLYIEKESIPKEIDTSLPFEMKLETGKTVTHQGIYKSLCKIVIDLIPSSELSHFSETIGWINGSVMDTELPPYFTSYDRDQVHQPTVDIYLSNKPGQEPYCTAVVHILDVLFVFILPEVDVDKARFKTEASIALHVQKFMRAWGGTWDIEDSSEYTLAYPWVNWLIMPGDPQVQIRPKSDAVFMRYKKEEVARNEKEFPAFAPDGISEAVVTNVAFDRHSFEPVTMAELHQVSVNYNGLVCTIDKTKSTVRFSMAFNFSDSTNRLSYFDFSFDAEVHLDNFERYIEVGDYFCIDYHLRDYLCGVVMEAANKELLRYTAGTDLEPITVTRLLDRRTIRQLYYRVPVDEGRYLVVKDAEMHNL